MTTNTDGVEQPVVAAADVVGDGKPNDDDDNVGFDNQREQQQQQQGYTMSFEDLTVYVPGIERNCCGCRRRDRDNNNPLTNCFREYLGVSVEQHDPFYALQEISGHLTTGQMCLVLGGDQQHKSTLLRTLSGRPSTIDEVGGNVRLNGMTLPRSLQGMRRLCPYISASDQTHSPVSTVRETFEFAAECTSNGEQTKEQISRRVDDMLKALALDNVGDTVVGDENLRGVSGGQKRRVTIGEMAIGSGAKFLFCDAITAGLSSSDSIGLISKLKATCETEKQFGAMVSLEQPSDEMVEMFDSVLVLSTRGEMMYFGPVDRRSLSQIFLETDGDGKDGEIAVSKESYADLVEGYRLEKNADEIEASIVRRFATSSLNTQLVGELTEIRSRAPPKADQNVSDLLPSTKYSTHGWYQFKILMERRKKLISRNAVTFTRIGIAVVFGVIIGSLFGTLGSDLQGALARTGYMFLNCFLVLMLSAAITIPAGFRDRVTLFKHRSAEFYSGRIAYASQVLCDLPLSLLEAIIISTISYFWVDMRSSAGSFFYFLGTLIALECVGQAMGRLLVSLYRKQVTANVLSSVVILIFGTVGGFMPSYPGLPPIVRWVSWITPVSYAFEGLMINQFEGGTFDDGLVGAGGNAVTQSTESSAGDSWLSMYGLPRIDFGTPQSVKIFNIFVLFLFAIVYDYFGQMLLEKNRGWFFNQTRKPVSTVQQSFSMTAPKIVQVISSKSSDQNKNVESNELDDDISWPKSLCARGLCYDVPLKRGLNISKRMKKTFVKWSGKKPGDKPSTKEYDGSKEKNTLRLLNSVDVRFTRGRMACLMGTSGAGKTTLMDVIAGYKTGGKISGSIIIDGIEKEKNIWKKISGYAEQQDNLNPYLTVQETLSFTAQCRVSKNPEAMTTKVLKLMNLDEFSNVVVGREVDGEGLPKHARKRLTIALALVHSPKILFLDEPTTGLSQVAARMVMESMKAATEALDLILVATIHQPSKEIWSSFDDCCLLSRGGRVCYMGPIGKDSEDVLGYFNSISNRKPKPDSNPADFCLDILSGMEAKNAEDRFNGSSQRKTLEEHIDNDASSPMEPPALDLRRINNPIVEVGLLTVRHLIVEWRNPSYSLMRFVSSATMSIYLGILFSGDKSSIDGAVFSIGAIFFLVFVLVIPMQAAVVPLIEDRAVLYRETVSGTYSRLSYGIGQLLADQPFHLVNTLVMFVCFYFLVDFKQNGEEIGYFILMLYLSNLVINSIGQLFALVLPNEESANGLGGLSVMLSVILMGFLITVSAMPAFYVGLYWINLFHYILQGLVTNELAENEYFVNISGLLPDLTDSNTTSVIGFAGSGGSGDTTSRQQIASFMSLVDSAGPGTNENSGDFLPLVNCTISSSCFTDQNQTLAGGFIDCYIFSGIFDTPPCRDEFGSFLDGINISAILPCFIDIPDINLPEIPGINLPEIPLPELPSFGEEDGETEAPTSPFEEDEDENVDESVSTTNIPTESPDGENRQLQEFSDILSDIFSNRTQTEDDKVESENLDLVLCLLRAILPPDIVAAIEDLMGIFDSLVGLLPIIVDIADQGGLYIPGELILSFFGWAQFSIEDGFNAPWKWWYCMGAVAIFVVFIESLKLFAVSFIVWTNR